MIEYYKYKIIFKRNLILDNGTKTEHYYYFYYITRVNNFTIVIYC